MHVCCVQMQSSPHTALLHLWSKSLLTCLVHQTRCHPDLCSSIIWSHFVPVLLFCFSFQYFNQFPNKDSQFKLLLHACPVIHLCRSQNRRSVSKRSIFSYSNTAIFWVLFKWLLSYAIALNPSLGTGYTLYALTEQTDTSSHSRLFVDGRLAGSSCLVGCAGVGPLQTSWQPCLRQPCARLLSSGMIHVEQKHHSTQSLAPRPAAICKTLQSNTRTSYDPQHRGVNRKGTPPSRHVSEVKASCHIELKNDRGLKKDPWGEFIDHGIAGTHCG